MIKILDDLVGKYGRICSDPSIPLISVNELRAAIPVVEAQQKELFQSLQEIAGDIFCHPLFHSNCKWCRAKAALARVKGA